MLCLWGKYFHYRQKLKKYLIFVQTALLAIVNTALFSSLFFLSFSIYRFSPTLGGPRKRIFSMLPYFDPTRGIYFMVDYRCFFLLFMASVRSRPPGPPAVPGVLHNSSSWVKIGWHTENPLPGTTQSG